MFINKIIGLTVFAFSLTALAQDIRIGATNQVKHDILVGIKHGDDAPIEKNLKPNESFYIEVPDSRNEVTAQVTIDDKTYECQMYTRASARSGHKTFLIKKIDPNSKTKQAECSIRFMPLSH